MVFTTEEERTEMIYGFIQFAYGEMQTVRWTTRRNDFRLQHHTADPYIDDRCQGTFQETMEKRYNGDLELTLIHFFCNEIKSVGWFDSYCVQQRPELDTRDEDYYYYWVFDEVLNDWIDSDHYIGDVAVDVADALKDILGLDFCLK
jgi:hypothetical protein